MTRFTAALALVVVVAIASLAALDAGSVPRAFAQTGEIRVAIPWTPENLDPTMNLSSIRAVVDASMFDSLVGRDADNRIVPELAESWRLLDDTTWQFTLRKGVVFHDGEPFNAEAVKFTIQRVLDPNQKSPNRANIAEVSRVDVVDGSTVNVVTVRPYAPLLNRLLDFPIVPPKYPDGVEVTLDAPAGRYQGDKEIAEALAGQWQKAGIKPKVQVAEWGAYFKRYLGKQFPDAYLLGLGGPMQDADELYNLVSSKGRGLYYKNERVDDLFDLGRATMDPAKRRKIYADLARAMVDDATWVFLMQQVDIYAMRDRLTWTPRADQWMHFHAATVK